MREVLAKMHAPDHCGESWEISGVKDNISIVSEGSLKGRLLTELVNDYGPELVGRKNYELFGSEFPLLIKFLDANEDLSIQVHPNDVLAKKRHNSAGKTEMWYIIQADENAQLVSGFNKPTNIQEFVEKVNNGRLTEILNMEKVNDGDTFFIPAGRVHTIGKGLLLAEIQQTSDVTYRIYDFDRIDANGSKRELHIDESLEAIDFNQTEQSKVMYSDKADQLTPLVESEYFVTNKLVLNNPFNRVYNGIDSFKIIICVEGSVSTEWNDTAIRLEKGETCLLPAICEDIVMAPDPHVVLLETYIG